MVCVYLCQLHHHMCKDMKEPNNSIPEPAVGQRLLVSCARALWRGLSVTHIINYLLR